MAMENKTKGFWGRFVEGFKDSLVEENLEADLYFPDDRSRRSDEGELEYYRFVKGHTELVIELESGLEVPAGESVTVWIGGRLFREVSMNGGRVKMRLASKAGDEIPEIQVGDVVEVRYGEVVLLEGKFERD